MWEGVGWEGSGALLNALSVVSAISTRVGSSDVILTESTAYLVNISVYEIPLRTCKYPNTLHPKS